MAGKPKTIDEHLAASSDQQRAVPVGEEGSRTREARKRDLLYTCSVGTIDIASLSSEERLRLLEELWESLSATPEAIPLTTAQREELDRRLDELDQEGPSGIPWEDVLHRVRSHKP